MLDREVIQTRGFRNLREDDEVTGFQLAIRMPSYRGMWASLIDGVDVTIDGETFDRSQTRWTLNGVDYSLDELQHSVGVRWQLDDAAIITVPKPGGLSAGVHDVAISLALRMSYIPVEHQPTVITAARKATIVS